MGMGMRGTVHRGVGGNLLFSLANRYRIEAS